MLTFPQMARQLLGPERKKEQHRQELRSKELQSLRECKCLAVGDFQPPALIGRGAFGEARLVRIRDEGGVFARKSLEKSEMVLKNQVDHVKAERDVLASVEQDTNC
ncbi:hypothetical protein PI124_g11112 [Phytophthora idaei]|nr:hypothetical protein PI125_g11834 [Phytophthora idaei]KAG3154892.1 hypothetical protein PI126_g9411 [Phytophthora idaei]KAG3244090.1 hypothetical protein PI124_g11112 [Phytophthora idaei]